MPKPNLPPDIETAEIPNIVGVRLSPSDRVRFCDPGTLSLSPGDRVEIETDEGSAVGRVAIGSGQVVHSDLHGPLYHVIRLVERSALANTP